MNTVPDRVRDIVLRMLEVPESELTETGLFADLGVDSLTLIEVQAELEREFDIVIGHSELSRMVDLRSVREVVARTVADAAVSAA